MTSRMARTGQQGPMNKAMRLCYGSVIMRENNEFKIACLPLRMPTVKPQQPQPLPILSSIVIAIETFTEACGKVLAWLSLLMMVLLSLVVLLRYGFNIGAVALQESVTYLHATIFMLGAAYALKHGAHVRVDIFYRQFSPRAKAWVDSLGGIVFLLPICVYIFVFSWDFVLQSWQIREVSTESGGIPAVFLLKTLIPLMAINLGLQCLAEIIRSALILIDPAFENQKIDEVENNTSNGNHV